MTTTLERALAAYTAAQGDPGADWAAIAASLAGAVPKPRRKAVRKRGQPWPCWLVTFSDGWRSPAQGLTEARAHEIARERYEWRCGRPAPSVASSIMYEDAGVYFAAARAGQLPERTVEAWRLELPAEVIAAKWKDRARAAATITVTPGTSILTDAMLAQVAEHKVERARLDALNAQRIVERDARMAAREAEAMEKAERADAARDALVASLRPRIAALKARGMTSLEACQICRDAADQFIQWDTWCEAWEAFDETTAIAAE